MCSMSFTSIAHPHPFVLTPESNTTTTINNNSHLSGNSIGNVCGLETARCLEELHVAKQRLPQGERFAIDRASIDGIKASCDRKVV